MVNVGIIGARRIGKVHVESICSTGKGCKSQDACRPIHE